MVFHFDDFQLDYSLEVWTTLKFWSTETLYFKVRSTTLLIVVWSKTQRILRYKLLNIWVFWGNSEIQFRLDLAEVWICFSSNFSTELKNLPKSKLLAFKFSKTLFKGSSADSFQKLNFNPPNFVSSLAS